MTRRATPFRIRIVGHADVAPDQLLANPENWRIHPSEQAKQLLAVMERVGWVKSVIVNQRTSHLVDGHERVGLALSRNEPTVPVDYIDVSEEEERLLLLTLDPLAAMASRDEEKLADLIAQTEPDFSATEIDFGKIHRPPRTRRRGLSHDVKECACCKRACEPGCGCYREEA